MAADGLTLLKQHAAAMMFSLSLSATTAVLQAAWDGWLVPAPAHSAVVGKRLQQAEVSHPPLVHAQVTVQLTAVWLLLGNGFDVCRDHRAGVDSPGQPRMSAGHPAL